MPRISIYLPDAAYKRVREEAKLRHLSTSKVITEAVEAKLNKGWPEDFFALAGSITDPTFEAPEEMTSEDLPRESFD